MVEMIGDVPHGRAGLLGRERHHPQALGGAHTGGATGYTDYPALDGQPSSPSSSSMVALDGPRVA